MAIVIKLKLEEAAPQFGDSILITVNASGKFDTVIRHGTQIAYDNGRWPLEQALQLAQKDAAFRGIATIYLRAVADAARS
jgi:hypothetical protein